MRKPKAKSRAKGTTKAKAKPRAKAKAKPRVKAKAKAPARGWIITTSRDRPIRDVAKDLAAAGLTGGRVLKEIGNITGSADGQAVTKLRKVRGVVDVAPDVPVNIGPPDSSETW